MQRTTLIVVGLVLTASLVGATGPALAQSDDELVTLTIEVVNPSTNQQLGGVTLVATWDGGGESRVTTASNGKAFIDVPEAASVEITPDDDSYTRNEPYRIRVATEKSHTIDVFRKADLDVVVRDAEGPVANARVALAQDGIEVVSGRTNEDGLFRSGTVAQGRYTLTAVKPGYYRSTKEVIVAGSPEETIDVERGRVDYDVVVEDPHFDPAASVSDATISIEGVGEFQTDQRGNAAVLLPVNSEVEVEVSKEGYQTATRTLTVNESEGSATFDLSREPRLSLTTLNERVVVGEVVPVEVTNAYGEPASDVAILVDGEQVTRTDSDGRATVRIEEAGDRSIQARRGGTTSEAVTIRGIGEGSGEATQAEETDADTPATETETGDSPGGALTGLFGPIAVVVGLLVVLVLGVLYWRRRNARASDPSAWADDPLETPGSSGSVGFGDDTGTESTADAAAEVSDQPMSEDESGSASVTGDETGSASVTGDETGSASVTEDETGTGGEGEVDAEGSTSEPDSTDAGAGAESESMDAGAGAESESMDAGDGAESESTDAGVDSEPEAESDEAESDEAESDGEEEK